MKNVLIADNQPVVRLGVATLIKQLPGLRLADQVSSGNEAYASIERANIDIFITELQVGPGESGLLTIKRIHNAFPNVRILVFSSCEDQNLVNQALHDGATSYIFKSSSLDELITGLRYLAAGKRYLDNNIMITKQDLLAISNGNSTIDTSGYENLSKREQELFPLIALGYSNKAIAQKLFISAKTVEAHKASITRKLKLNSQAELIRYAVRHHLIAL